MVEVLQKGDSDKKIKKFSNIFISTPGKLVDLLKNDRVILKNGIKVLVFNEADLQCVYGFKEDIYNLIKHLPTGYQTIITSSSVSDDVRQLKQVMLQNPVTINLEKAEQNVNQGSVSHYYKYAEEEEKVTILLSLFKFQIFCGKMIIFTNSDDRCYKLHTFLKYFGYNSLTLSRNMPQKVKADTVTEYNRNVSNILIISCTFEDDTNKELKADGGQKALLKTINYSSVSNIVNLDFPSNINSFVDKNNILFSKSNHLTILYLVNVNEKDFLDQAKLDLKTLYNSKDEIVMEFKLKFEDVSALQYRCAELWRAITKQVIRSNFYLQPGKGIELTKKLRNYLTIFNRGRETNKLSLKSCAHLTSCSKIPEYITMNKTLGGHKVKKNSKRLAGHKRKERNPLK